MAAHFRPDDKLFGSSPNHEVTTDVELESCSQSELGSASGDDEELDSLDSGSGRYSGCKSANFSSTRSWYRSPDNNDFLFGGADLQGFLNDSGGSRDSFVDALDEYFDAERDHNTRVSFSQRSGFLIERSSYEDDEEHEPSTLHGTSQSVQEGGGINDHENFIENGGESHSDYAPAAAPVSEDESTKDGDQVRDLHVQSCEGDGLEALQGKNDDGSSCNEKHPLEEESSDSTSHLETPQGLESEASTRQPPGELNELVLLRKVELESTEVKEEEPAVARTPERRRCVMRLGSKEAEDLLQLDVAEIVKPLRLSSADPTTDWSREHLGPDELSRYVETVDVRETYMDTVLDMEEILLDSGETSGGHSFWKGTNTATRTSRAPASSVYDGLWKVDSVEVVGARQRRGGASLGERVAGIKEHTIYRIRVRSGGNEWEIERRYRDFVDLFVQLKRMFNAQSRVQLPSPWEKVTPETRKLFGNTSPEVVEIRSALLQVCLQSTLQAGVPMSTAAPLLRFLFPSPGERRLPMLTSTSQHLPDLSREQNDLQLKELGSPKSVTCGSPDRNAGSVPFGRTIRLVLQIQTRKPMKQQLVNQRNLCAGCYEPLTSSGSSLVSGLVQTFGLTKPRLCEYTGQLYCTECHLNEVAILPAFVLRSWDFTPRLVSQLAKAYLDSIYDQPMLCVSAVNPFLYSRVSILAHVAEMRKRLHRLMDSIRCPSRVRIQQSLGTRRYLLEQNDFYALHELADLSRGAFAVLPQLLKGTVEKLTVHITRKCSFCSELAEPCGAGILCQRPSEMTYPFQDEDVHRCQLCNTPYHKNCFKIIETCKLCTRDDTTTPASSSHQSPTFSEHQSTSPTSLDASSVFLEDHQSSTKSKRTFLATLFGPRNTDTQARRNSSILSMNALLGPVDL